MKSRRFVPCGSVLVGAAWVLGMASLLALGASALGADWPRWGKTDSCNAVADEKNLPDNFVPGDRDPQGGGILMNTTQNVRWAARLGGGCYGNPTVANGRVFVGCDDQSLEGDARFKKTNSGMLKCFDEATGKLLWQLVTPARTGFPKEWHFGYQKLGVCSSPAVDGNEVYVVTGGDDVLCLSVTGLASGNRGPFTDESNYMAASGQPPIKLGSADADIIWRYNILDELKVIPHDVCSTSILIHGDFLYLSTSNGVNHAHDKPLAPDAPAIIVLNKKTGKLAAVENEGISKRMFHTQWSSACLAKAGNRELIVIGGTDGYCYAFEPLTEMPEKPVYLKKVWRYDCNPGEYRTRDGKPIDYLAGDKRKKTSPNKNDGNYLGPSEVIATPVFANGRIFVAIGQDPLHGRGKGILHCIDPSGTGDISKTGCVWTYTGLDRTMSDATIADGLVYIPDVVGRLHCVDADTGKHYWTYETGNETWGSALVADGKVYLGTQKMLYIFAAGKEAKLLNKINLGSPVLNTPIAANNTLYFASQRYIWAVQQMPGK